MKRTPLKPGKPPKRRTSLKAVNRKRKKAEFARAYHSKARVRWVQSQPSVVGGATPCVNAHVPPKGYGSGAGRKADYRWIVPLTDAQHRELHRVGRETFEREYGVNLAQCAVAVEEAWRAL